MAEQLKPVQVSPGTDTSLMGDEHVRVYRETGGAQGYLWNGVPTLLLSFTGRKTGLKRTIPIIFTPVENAFVIIASKGGSASHPKWYLSLLDNPEVELQIKDQIFSATARTAASPEREALWAEAVKAWPNYDLYQSRTDRVIPVVVLERAR
jgi:deazaflavin-dependent oxidoreductase (nitroreductase family)